MIKSEKKSPRIAIALTNDTISFQSDLETAISKFNEEIPEENTISEFEIVAWCSENTEEWKDYFSYQTPFKLIRKIHSDYQTDIIICVFWKNFGVDDFDHSLNLEKALEQASDEYKSDVRFWLDAERPIVKILLCERDSKLKLDAEKHKKWFISQFRTSLAEHREKIWLPFNKKSKDKNTELQEAVKTELWKIVESYKPSEETVLDAVAPLTVDLPDGWIYLNHKLQGRISGQKLSKSDADDFFDGTSPSPTFEIALSSSVPRRYHVGQLLDNINDAVRDKKTRVILLYGPGGEGKSTILQQVAVDLIRQKNLPVHVLFRENPNAFLPTSFIEKLINYEGSSQTFVFISDKAHIIGNDVFDCTKKITETWGKKHNIQFVLATRGTDWEWQKNPPNREWNTLIGEKNFRRITVNRLELDDAREIVKAWAEAESLGNLENKFNTEEARANYFFGAAQDKYIKGADSNSFFSAILDVRKSKTLKGYVEEILDRLSERTGLRGETLDYYFAYIVALHADGFPLLTKPILQLALECEDKELYQEVLAPLADERSIQDNEDFVFARHDVFAEYAKRILMERRSKEFFYQIIADLVVAAQNGYLSIPSSVSDTDIKIWHSLIKEYFYNRKDEELAITIAKTLAERMPDSVNVTAYSKLIRGRKGDKQLRLTEALNTLLDYFDKIERDKGFYIEWGVVENLLGNSFLSVWLTGIAISDKIQEAKRGVQPPLLRLVSLAESFIYASEKISRNESFDIDGAEIFIQAAKGAMLLANDEKADNRAKKDFGFIDSPEKIKRLRQRIEKIQPSEPNSKGSKPNLEQGYQKIVKGIMMAGELYMLERANLPESMPKPNELTFRQLSNDFGIKASIKIEWTPYHRFAKQLSHKTEYQADRFPFTCDTGSLEIFDAKGVKPNLSEDCLNVLKCFFGTDGEGFKSKLTFSEVATIYEKKPIYDQEEAKKIAANFARNLRRQLKNNYGVDNEEEIIKTWFGNGYQLGNKLVQGRRENRDAIADRPKEFLNENDQRFSSKTPTSDDLA